MKQGFIFRRPCASPPAFADAHNNLGNMLLQKGRLDEAMAHFQKALESLPDFADARSNLGAALLQKGQPEEAVAQFQRALEIVPSDVLTRYNLGSALLKSGHAAEAVTQFQSVLRCAPISQRPAPSSHCTAPKRATGRSYCAFPQALQLNPNLRDRPE